MYFVILANLPFPNFNLNKIQSLLDSKKLNKDTKIDMAILKKEKIINKNYLKFKILGSGEIKDKLVIEADFISKSAKDKLEKIGGSIQIKK